ncbi:MAG: LysR family transcriptional regulator [Polyangiales bacterium]
MLDDIDLFLQVVSCGSVNKAARVLAVPKSTVSRRLAALEDALGASLFVRDASGIALTHAGRTLRDECERPMGALRDALAGLTDDLKALRGTVRVALPRTFAVAVCPPVLRAFARRHPDVTLELDLDDAVTDPVHGAWDAAIRIGPLPDGDLRARLLGEVRGVLVASPAYLAGREEPTAESLARVCGGLVFRSPSFGGAWEMLGPDGAARTFELPVALAANDLAMLRGAALEGLGVARLPRYLVADDLRDGRLAQVLPGWTTAPRKVHALHPAGRRVAARVRVFLDHVAQVLHAMNLDTMNPRG